MDRTITKVLSGHTSPETAFVVEDYPYGYRERTKIRYWLEHKPRKGYRFTSQTVNPKTGLWNKPKQSTYAELAAAMYLDEKGHCTWAALGQYSSHAEIAAFVKDFPTEVPVKAVIDLTRAHIILSAATIKANEAGESGWMINGVKQPAKSGELEKNQQELAQWRELLATLEGMS